MKESGNLFGKFGSDTLESTVCHSRQLRWASPLIFRNSTHKRCGRLDVSQESRNCN